MFGIVFCFAGLHALLYVQKKDMVPVWAIPVPTHFKKGLLSTRAMHALTLHQPDGDEGFPGGRKRFLWGEVPELPVFRYPPIGNFFEDPMGYPYLCVRAQPNP